VVRQPYPVAVRLCWVLGERWPEIDAAYYQIRLLRERPHRLANLVYTWCVERIGDQEALDEWKQELVDLLPWQDAQSEAAAESESESFMDMQAKGAG